MKSYKKNQTKKIGVGITIVLMVGIIGFLFVNGVFEINAKNLDKSIQNIPQTIQETTTTAKDIATDTIKNSPNLQETLNSAQEQVMDNVKSVQSNFETSLNPIPNVKDTEKYTQSKVKYSVEPVQPSYHKDKSSIQLTLINVYLL